MDATFATTGTVILWLDINIDGMLTSDISLLRTTASTLLFGLAFVARFWTFSSGWCVRDSAFPRLMMLASGRML